MKTTLLSLLFATSMHATQEPCSDKKIQQLLFTWEPERIFFTSEFSSNQVYFQLESQRNQTVKGYIWFCEGEKNRLLFADTSVPEDTTLPLNKTPKEILGYYEGGLESYRQFEEITASR